MKKNHIKHFSIGCAATLVSASLNVQASDCNPDFGDKILHWVNNEVSTQSRQLAEADYTARAFNYRLVGYERFHVRVAQLDAELELIARAIAGLDASSRTDLALAIEREQTSERFLTKLYSLAAEIEALRKQNTEMLTPLDRAAFARLGLGAVGRETLIASMREIGASSESTLAARYSVYIQVTLDENGNQKIEHTAGGMMASAGLALIQTGEPYSVAAGSIILIGGMVIDASCQKNWEQQQKRVADAARIFSSKLIEENAQWVMVKEAESAESMSFAEHGRKAAAVIDSLEARWKTLFAANAARAGAADAVLTVAKVDQIRRDLARGVDPAEIRSQVAMTEVAADIGRVNDAVTLGRIPILTSCLSPAGVAAEEDQLDSVRFAKAQFKALRAQAGFALLHPLLDQSNAIAEAAEAEVQRSGPTANKRKCPAKLSSVLAYSASNFSNAGRSVIDKRFEDLNISWPVGIQLAATDSRTTPLAKGLRPSHTETAVVGSFCVTIKNNGVYTCGGTGSGTPYGMGFPDTGNPRVDAHAGANDGGFGSDNRRMSQKIEQASQNIAQRIQSTRMRVSEARASFPTWNKNNTEMLNSMSARVSQATAADTKYEDAFRSVTAPLLSRVASQLDSFRKGAADPSAIAALVHSVGGADMRLSSVPRTALPANVPAIIGITALDASFGAGSTTAERAILRERWKAEEELQGDTAAFDRSKAALAQAGFTVASTRGAGNHISKELLLDSASLRFAATGRVGATIAVVRPDGSIDRVAISKPSEIPDNALVNVVQTYRHDQDFFLSASARLDSELASGASFAGRRGELLGTARSLRDRASSAFQEGNVADAHTWLSMAIGVLDIATRFVPGVDWGRDVYEAVAGKDLFTGTKLDEFDRISAVIGVLTAGIGNNAIQVGKVIRRIDGLPPGLIDKIYDFGKTVDGSTLESLKYHRHAEERMLQRKITPEEIREVLDNHTPLWSRTHRSYTAVGHVSTRPERIAVAVKVERNEIRTVILEKLDDVPFEEMVYAGGTMKGKRQYVRMNVDGWPRTLE